MKKSLLLAAALFASTAMFAQDLYIVGNDVNGATDWGPGSLMTKSGDVYTWSGTSLNDFKINNGGWGTPEYNIGNDGSRPTVGTPFNFVTGDGSANINFGGTVKNPKVTLNYGAGTILVEGEFEGAGPDEPGELTFYIIGDNVNGANWALQQADAAFEEIADGVYQWAGDVLGTGFKINDGTWGDTWNIGSAAGAEIMMNEPYYYSKGGGSGNIAFGFGATELKNPVVKLDLNAETITIVGGTPSGESHWYVIGINGNYDLSDENLLTQKEGTEIYTRVVTVVETVGGVKISDTGNAHQYGTTIEGSEPLLTPESLLVDLDVVEGQGGDIPYELPEGTYTVVFDKDNLTLEFVEGAEDAVEAIDAASNVAPVYYNLQGVKVSNPEKGGILIKVQGGKATKIVK